MKTDNRPLVFMIILTAITIIFNASVVLLLFGEAVLGWTTFTIETVFPAPLNDMVGLNFVSSAIAFPALYFLTLKSRLEK